MYLVVFRQFRLVVHPHAILTSGAHRIHHVTAQVVWRQRIVHRQRLLTLIERQLCQLVDQFGDRLRTVLDQRTQLLTLLWLQLIVLGAEDFRESLDRIQRRTQLVRDIRDKLILHVEGLLGLLALLFQSLVLFLQMPDAQMMLQQHKGQDEDDDTDDGEDEPAFQTGVLFLQQLLFQFQALVVHLYITAGHDITVRHQDDRVVDLLELCHLLIGLVVIAHPVIDQGQALGLLIGRQLLAQAHCLLVVAVQDLMVHLHHRFDRTDTVRCLQGHQLVVDTVVEFLVILVKGKLTQTEQGPTLVDRCHVRLCQNLLGKFQTGLLVLTVVGDLHQLLQVVAGTLIGEVPMTELHSFQESLLRLLIVLLLKGVHSLDMQGDIMPPEAVLPLCIFSNLIGDLLCTIIILMGGLVSGLITPGSIEQALITQLMT